MSVVVVAERQPNTVDTGTFVPLDRYGMQRTDYTQEDFVNRTLIADGYSSLLFDNAE